MRDLVPEEKKVLLINCRDECGRSVPASEVESSGWEYLSIQGRYRCTICWRALTELNKEKL